MNRDQWQRAKELFDDALKRSPDERPRFLDERCDGDEELRCEVASLLANSEDAASFLERPAVGEVAEVIVGQKETSRVNQSFSHYKIIKPLGAGGMGEVFLAEDSELKRFVALKVLHAEFSQDAERLRRFVQEARAASGLNHPNILTIYEIGTANDSRFIASEFIKGETLRQKIQNLSLSETLDITIQIALALQAAHAAGIIHRDIKPENAMLREDNLVKVLDFGLAKLTEKTLLDGEAETRIQVATQAGMIMGTAAYMSPEQARGQSVDARTDIFSLGVVLYEMLTGKQPFAGETTSDAIAAILKSEAAPLGENAPAELQRIVRKTLQKNADERYQTAKDLLVDLRNLKRELEFTKESSHLPPFTKSANVGTTHSSEKATAIQPPPVSTQNSLPHPTSSAEYITREIKRHKHGVLVLLAALLATAIIVFYLADLRYPRGRGRPGISSIAVIPFANKSDNPDAEYLSDGISESLINSLSQLPGLKVIARSSSFKYKGKEVDVQEVAHALGVEAVLTGRVVQRGDGLVISVELVDARDKTQMWGEQYDRKMSDLLAIQREIAREIVEKLKLKVSGEEKGLAKNYTESNEAYQLYLKGRFYWNKRTVEANRKSIEYFDRAIEKDPRFALAYAGLADCYVVRSSRLPPREAVPKAKAAAMRALELDETLAEAHASLGRVLASYDWDWTSAEKEYKRAIELDPRYATAHQWYGAYLQAMGRHNEAIAERKRAQELEPLSLIINFELGLAFYFARDYDQAIEQFQKTLELDQNFPPVHGILPAAYEQKGMYGEAIAAFKKAISLRTGGERSLPIAGLGHVYAVSGKKSEARTALDELKQLSGQEYVPATGVALVYAGLGEKDQAFVWLEKAYDQRAFQMQSLKVEPRWDSLRSDPRFQDLIRRIGLPP